MITITKVGRKSLVVSESAFHNFYENAGWKKLGEVKNEPEEVEEVVEDTPIENEEVEETNDVSDEEWDEVMDDDVEKPLSEMSRPELEEKAASLGITVNKTHSNKQIRDLIKKANVG